MVNISGSPMNRLRGKFTSCKITRREDLTDDLFKIWLKPLEPFSFKPGQYCTIGVDGLERPYSIVSSPDEEEIELFIEVVPPPEGNLTPILHELDIGTELSLRPRAKGIFLFQPRFKNHVMVGTVTGTVPYVSMLRKFLSDPSWNNPEEFDRTEHKFFVLEGASYRDEFGYDDELTYLADNHSFINFLPSISRPKEERNSGWVGAVGRINSLVQDFVKTKGLIPSETCIYACGHPQMIEDVKKRFSGTEFEFLEERFWKEDE